MLEFARPQREFGAERSAPHDVTPGGPLPVDFSDAGDEHRDPACWVNIDRTARRNDATNANLAQEPQVCFEQTMAERIKEPIGFADFNFLANRIGDCRGPA